MEISKLYSIYTKHFLVAIDSRKIVNNSIFFALKGDNFNGNIFASTALENGALYAIVDQEEYVTSDKYILVDNVLTTLQQLAKYHREHINTKFIALTGSNGKTTTKELITAVLKQSYDVVATKGNLNNHIGVPLTLLSVRPSCDFAVVEMGANHPGEIAFLSSLVQPDYGYITNFGKAHLDGFGSLEGVICAKSELYDFLLANEKYIFVNNSDPIQLARTRDGNCLFLDSDATLIENSERLIMEVSGIKISTNLIGAYNLSNVLAAFAIGKYFDVPISKVKFALESYVSSNNRSQVMNMATNKIILDAYNANPTSMSAAIKNFYHLELEGFKCKMLILGDMYELGVDSLKEHQEIVNLLEYYNFTDVYLIGKEFSKTTSTFFVFESFKVFNSTVMFNDIRNTFVLIKGSRAMALERCLDLF